MPFGEFESRVDKKGQAILTLGTTTLWISVNSFPFGQELRKRWEFPQTGNFPKQGYDHARPLSLEFLSVPWFRGETTSKTAKGEAARQGRLSVVPLTKVSDG